MNERQRNRSIGWLVLLSLVVGTLTGVGSVTNAPEVAEAGVFFNDTEFTYKEYWDVISKIDAANDVSYACE